MLNSLDLFSGYGGISLGLSEYVKPVGYCEIEKYPRAILAGRISEGKLPFAPIFPDVRKLRGKPGAADIITGGFPCQDISVAGNGAGLAGERSGLFFEIVRLTKEIRPSFVFLENVPAIRTRGLRQVVGAFTEMGYDCRWTCLSASSIGANHKRERWFLLAHSNSSDLRDQQRGRSRKNREGTDVLRINGKEESMADPSSKRLEGFNGEKPRHSKSSQSFRKEWWEIEPDVGRVVNGTAFRVDRIKAIGNGVVPLQVKTAFEKLMGIKPTEQENLK